MQVQNISMYSNYKTLNSTKKAVNKTDISFNGRRDDRYFPEFETTQSLNRAERYFAELCSLANQFRHFAKQYTSANPKITVQVVDATERQDIYNKYGISTSESAIVSQSPEKSKTISLLFLGKSAAKTNIEPVKTLKNPSVKEV